MPENKAAESEGRHHDKRVLVLLLIGVCIGLPQLFDHLRPFFAPRQPEENPPALVWLETPTGIGNGLYWLDDQAQSWPKLLTVLGRPTPLGPLQPFLPGEIIPPAAYRLPLAGPPAAIPLPAQLAPIFFQPIPINQASAEVLMTIPGIGRRLAAVIVAYRAKTGGIKDRAALMAVDGIGEKKAAIIANCVRFE